MEQDQSIRAKTNRRLDEKPIHNSNMIMTTITIKNITLLESLDQGERFPLDLGRSGGNHFTELDRPKRRDDMKCRGRSGLLLLLIESLELFSVFLHHIESFDFHGLCHHSVFER